MDGLHCLGAETVGLDFGSLLQAGGAFASSAIAEKEASDAKDAKASDEKKKLADAIAADVAASNAVAQAAVSAKLKSASASVDATAAQVALAKQDSAGAGLSDDSVKSRADAADKQLDDALKRAHAKPKDAFLAEVVKAWTQTVNKAHGSAVSSAAEDAGAGDKKGKGKKDKDEKESWLTRKVVGPIPGYGVLVGGAGILGAAGYAVKRIFF